MKNILPLLACLALICACHSEHSHNHDEGAAKPQAISHTIYTEHSELFVEFEPPVVGIENRFAAHFTVLGEKFLPLSEAVITLALTVNGGTVSTEASKPDVPGIFRLRLTPTKAGTGSLLFTIKTKNFTDEILIDSVIVYPDEKTAIENHPQEHGSDDVTYLKEQAWKIEFANMPVKKQAFRDVIKTSGQILSAPGDETMVTANANGIVSVAGNKIIPGIEIDQGTVMFRISGGNLAEGNATTQFLQAKANYEKAKADYDRASELVKDKIVSEKDFQETELNYQTSKAAYDAIAKNYNGSGQTITSPASGFLKHIFVNEGQYVTAGMPLASISKNKKLILQANVSQKYFEDLSKITSATFKATEQDSFYDVEKLNGKLISFGKSTGANTPFIPVTFEIDNTFNIVPGSVVEVFLKSGIIRDAMVIPASSLIEEQGNFFVYIQTAGESFQKREVKTGASDGISVQILSGIAEGERVVTKGAFQVKLSQASGTLPEHGHEH